MTITSWMSFGACGCEDSRRSFSSCAHNHHLLVSSGERSDEGSIFGQAACRSRNGRLERPFDALCGPFCICPRQRRMLRCQFRYHRCRLVFPFLLAFAIFDQHFVDHAPPTVRRRVSHFHIFCRTSLTGRKVDTSVTRSAGS